MTQKETEILKRFAELLSKMDKKKQERILLLAEDAALLCAAERETPARNG